MIRNPDAPGKERTGMAVKPRSVLRESNEFVDFLLREFEEASRETLCLLERLKKTDESDLERDRLEGAFYGALVDLRDHVRDLVQAWDALTDSLPDNQE
jgi:hypothetical protein